MLNGPAPCFFLECMTLSTGNFRKCGGLPPAVLQPAGAERGQPLGDLRGCQILLHHQSGQAGHHELTSICADCMWQVGNGSPMLKMRGHQEARQVPADPHPDLPQERQHQQWASQNSWTRVLEVQPCHASGQIARKRKKASALLDRALLANGSLRQKWSLGSSMTDYCVPFLMVAVRPSTTFRETPWMLLIERFLASCYLCQRVNSCWCT